MTNFAIMEAKEVRPYAPLLHSLHRCNGNPERQILMSHMNDNSLQFLCKMLGKCIENPSMLGLSPARLKKLRGVLSRDKSKIKYLTKTSGNLQRKRKLMQQSGEGLGMLVGILSPILINLVKNLISKKKVAKK